MYWRDVRLTTLDDAALVELVDQVEALTRNSRVLDSPECLSMVARRLADLLAEVDTRIGQLRFF